MYGRFLQFVSKIIIIFCKIKKKKLWNYISPVDEVQGTAMAGVHDITDLDEVWYPENGIQFHMFYRKDIYRHPGSKEMQCFKSK